MTGTVPVLVHLAGPLRVDRDGRALAPAEIGSRKGRALLRLLAARRGDVLTGAEIAAVLWPEDLPADPDAGVGPLVRRAVRGAVPASLVGGRRRVLGAGAVVGGRAGYRLGTVETDVDRARRLLDDAERDPPALASAAARSAVRLLGDGEALSEEPDAVWTGPLRAEVVALRRRARHLLGRAALGTGDPDLAEDAARRALEEDPLDEAAVRLLMRAFLDRGLPRTRCARTTGSAACSPTSSAP